MGRGFSDTPAAWDSVTEIVASRLEAVQRRAAKLIYGIKRTNRKASTIAMLTKHGK